MVICLKIKTLDSQTYEFSVDDEVSVREFKETIAEKTNISADLQRLIYCGRVLVDEKKLKEYDVHGKVVHVVERPPPASRLTTQTNDASNRRQRDGNDGNVRASPIFRALDGMVLGAMTIPVNASASGQGTANAVPHLNPSSSFCMNRITVARHMLECANNIAAYLENPERGLNNTSLDILTQGRWAMESTVVEVGISAAGNVDIPQNIAEALHGAVSAALRQNGHPNVTVVQLPTVLGPNGSATVSSHSQPRAIQFNPSELAAAMRDQRDPTNNQGESSTTNSTSDSTSANTNENANQDTEERERPAESNPQHRTGTVVLGQVVQQMQLVQRRLDPFIEQYLNILMNDPTFEENDTAGRERAQRVYDRVSEALHYMSHAQHAISDLMLDLSQNSPRYLCCRPILVEQGGFVSSNNYLASFLNPNGNNNESTTANNNSASNQSSNPTATQILTQTSPPAAATDNVSGPSATSTPSPPNQTSTNARDLHRIISPFLIPVPNRPPPTSTTNPNANAESGNQARQPIAEIVLNLAPSRVIIPNPQIPVARLIQAVLDSASFDTDLHVQINGLGSGQQQSQSQNAAANSQNNTTSTNIASNTESSATNTTESAQPRVTTATLPTTSTQTRSTARPQVHVANIPSSQMWNARVIPANMLSSFDRFLQCSSHHIRDNEMGDISQPGTNPFVRPRGTRFRQRRQPQESTPNPTANRVPVTPPESSTQSSSSPEPNFESINTPINLFGSIFTLGDLLDIRPSPVTFNRIRNDLHTFIVENLFSGAQINAENMQQAINQVIERLHDALVFLPQFDLPDYDSRASVENLLRASLPFVINLINEDESDEFGIRLLRQCMTFIRRLFVILITCVGRENAELYLNQIAFMAINSNNELEQDTSRALQRHLMAAIRELDLNRLNGGDVQQYLVLRRPAPPTSMCTDSNNFLAESTSTTPSVCAMNIPTATPRTRADNEPLPSVDVGSEQWHSNFPTSWLPLITRDIERQRRQSPQRPFSDAYISGMSAKRRKLIQSTKTNGGFPTLIAEGVRHAIQATGSGTSNNSIDDVATSIANDSSVQLSYREAFSTSIQERLRTDPDFNPLRFPNTTKFFDK